MTPDNHIILVGSTYRIIPRHPVYPIHPDSVPEVQLMVFYLDALGNELWRTNIKDPSYAYPVIDFYNTLPVKVLIERSGNIHLFEQRVWNGYTSGPFIRNGKQHVLNKTGTYIWSKEYWVPVCSGCYAALFGFSDAAVDKYDNILLSGTRGSGTIGSFFMKLGNFSTNYEILINTGTTALRAWQSHVAFGHAIELACHKHVFTVEKHEMELNFLVKRDASGYIVTSTYLNNYSFSPGVRPFPHNTMTGQQDGILFADSYGTDSIRLLKTDCNGFYEPTRVIGKFFLDENQNCRRDAGEAVVPDFSFAFSNTTFPGNFVWTGITNFFKYRAKTNAQGEFEFSPIEGAYELVTHSLFFKDYFTIPDCSDAYQFDITEVGDTVFLEIPLSEEEISTASHSLVDTELAVYPNPATHSLFIETDKAVNRSEIFDIQLFNHLGQIVLRQSSPGPKIVLDLPIPAGMYFLSVQSEHHSFSSKIIKQ